MISSFFHKGSGLGNQLHRYVMARVLALDKGYEFGMVAPELFKGKDFMNLNMGFAENPLQNISYIIEPETGKCVSTSWARFPLWEEWDKHCYDPDINFVEDDTIIDGNFEDERYFEHRLPEIAAWLETNQIDFAQDFCLIGFRGGEYYTVPELGLPKEYYDRAIAEMLKINPNMEFEVHTDDVGLAEKFFPNYEIIRDISINWRSMRYARYAIIANSSFYILPRLLQHQDDTNSVTIAPKYFNRYNVKRWDYPQFYYKKFRYI